MSYRGGDLDLRTPQARSGGERASFEPPINGREFEDAYAGDTRHPIWVDETLLACCNHAYDVALAHRSGDVRIEHLLYALTRIDDAAEVLEKHGVRDASLRREAGLYIASEIPLGPTNGQATPRRSQALEQALRLAAKHAYQRSRPAGVGDLLHVFTELKPELPGLQLLHRNMPGLIGAEPSKPAAYHPLPDTAFLGASAIEPARRASRPAYYDDYGYAEAASYRHAMMQSHTDMVQNQRLAALEKMLMGLREETGRFADDFAGRFVSLEKSFTGSRGGHGEVIKETADKITGLERGLLGKLEELSRQAEQLSGRLETMEARLQSAYASGGIDLTPLERRLEDMEQRLAARTPAAVDLSPLRERLDRMETTLRDERSASAATLKFTSERMAGDLDQRLAQFERLIGSGQQVSVDLMPIEGRLNDIETAILGIGDPERKIESFASRLEALEQTLAARMASMEQARVADRDRLLQQGLETHNELKKTGQQVTGAVAGQGQVLQRLEAVLQQRIAAIAKMSEAMEAGRADVARRMEAVETMLLRHGQEAAEGRETSVRELGEVHEAIVKLNANQHTLAGAIDQWRSESVSDLNTIATRLAALDQDTEEPMRRLQLMSDRMDGLYRATVERYHRRNRFWYWLFGTDDWIGASWPSQTAKVEQELRALSADEHDRMQVARTAGQSPA